MIEKSAGEVLAFRTSVAAVVDADVGNVDDGISD